MSDHSRSKDTLSLATYRLAAGAMGPLADFALKQRLKKGKEHPDRVTERQGIAGLARPEGELIWIHGASVGESLSILPLVEALSRRHPDCHFLVTTGTVTSAQLMADRLPVKAVHQFAPLDHPAYVRSFLDHWQPHACIFVESELWPNLIQITADRGIPMALVNGRISPKSYKNWKQRPEAINILLSDFKVLMAQDQHNRDRIADLGQREVAMFGNLKMAAPDLPADPGEVASLHDMLGARPRWLAASTHPGEEEYILEVHRTVREKFPQMLTIIVPRHPNRGDEVAGLLHEQGLVFARRSAGDIIKDETEIYLADTLGEMGLFYRLSDISFLGGSLIEIGGHNPLEPARLRSAILYGPHIFNFVETYKDMRASGGTALVRNERDLSASLIRLLTDNMTREEMARRAETWVKAGGAEVLSSIITALEPILPPEHKVE